MKIFKTILKNFELVGIIRDHPFNQKFLIANATFVIGFASVFIFAFHVAHSMNEYMDSFFILTGMSGIFLCYATFSFNLTQLFRILDRFDKLFHDDGK